MDDDSIHSSYSSSSSSSSSDDDFLTSTGGGGLGGVATQQDREALVRKKLLESFYGASPSPGGGDGEGDEADAGDGDDSDDDEAADERKDGDDDDNVKLPADDTLDGNNTSNTHQQLQKQPSALHPSQIPLPFTATKSDLDSPAFRPKSHTLSHIAHSSAKTLLETNERLALDIRMLDSTMQTLVYENYSKFIDATDAIKSIGTNVGSVMGGMGGVGDSVSRSNIDGDDIDDEKKNDHGLDRLITGMERIRTASERSERLLRESRDAVAEKLRIQRLLTRLDALLSLPQTLRTYIAQGKYRMAVQSHASATEILGRHSAGFESLRSIESECGVILSEMVRDLKTKLVEWSGSTAGMMGVSGEGVGGAVGTGTIVRSFSNELGGGAVMTVSSPKSIAEIFECAGTLLMLYPSKAFSPGLDKGQCQSLALAACGQFLRERLIVGGHPEAEAGMDSPPGSPAGQKVTGADDIKGKNAPDTIVSELPISFLDGILESTTLYGVSFHISDNSPAQADGGGDVGQELLGKFVMSNFDKFIVHVRRLLIQKSEPDGNEKKTASPRRQAAAAEEEESKDDVNFLQVSIALSHLLRSVRELASGLALPEVGLDVEIASTLVDRTVELAETLVRRRVAVKFRELRGVVVRECLAPLVEEVVRSGGESGNDGKEDSEENDTQNQSASLVEIIQLASVALSDGLQMADDLIRATLQRSQLSSPGGAGPAAAAPGIVAPVDSAVVKIAVQKSAKLFGVWLASALEQLVGCEPSSLQDDKMLLEVWDEEGENENKKSNRIIIPKLEEDDVEYGNQNSMVGSSLNSTSFSSRIDSSAGSSKKKDAVSNLLLQLIVQLDDGACSERSYSNFLLAICEMCRLAERSMANTLNQSIQSAMDEDGAARVVADSANTLFGDVGTINPHRKGKDGLDSEGILSKRFQLASSRALAMYVMNRGAYAASELCKDVFLLSDARDPYAIPSRPREVCLKVFELAKATCEDCISIVGGDLFVAPVAPFPEEVEYVDVFGDRLTGAGGGSGGGGGASSGLQLDVERMFIQKTEVFPHASDRLEFTRNSVVSGVLHVALSAFLECVRSSVFSSLGYRQLKVDAVFLRYIIPHFVKDEFGTPEQNACSSLFNTIDDIMLKAGQRCFDHEVTNDDDYYDVEKDEIFTPYQLVQRFCESDEEGVMKRVAFS